MKIQHCTAETKINSKQQQKQVNNPTFKAGIGDLALNVAGTAMQAIENGGFLTSFLIQDGLGMTAPRVGAAFLRDKEVTGHYNIHEGFEVLGREGLTGPSMMAVAPIMMGLAAKCGKSTSVNSQLIKRLGNNLKEFVSKADFDKALLENKEKFKEAFYKMNIEQWLKDTIGKGNYDENSAKYILEQMLKYDNVPAGVKKGKYRSECLDNIIKHFNDLKLNTASDLGLLDKLRVGNPEAGTLKEFQTKNVLDALIKYSDDAIANNKHLNELDAEYAENIMNSALTKRFVTNIGTMAATLGVMSVLPKIYAKSEIAPGTRTAMELEQKKLANEQIELATNKINEDANANQVSFKGKGDNVLSKFGKVLNKHIKDGFASEFEYNGHNFTNTLMAGLSLFGLLAPRGMRAYDRAQVDPETGKKDLTELYEILIRDISSSLSVVFLVPMLTRALVTSYENASGFVLMHKDRSKSGLATAFDLLNPYSKAHVLTNGEINSLYNNINSQEKMVNFCKYINENNGDIHKIITKSEEMSKLVAEGKLTLPDLTKLSKADKNIKLTEFFSNLGKDGKVDKKTVDEIITKLMKGTGKAKNNKILSFARGLNSVPGLVTTFLISPYVLGWFIPRLTYANTRRLHEKAAQEKAEREQAKLSAAV